MDQQNYYYGKHNIGALNYQAAFANTGSEYQAAGYTSNHTSLHHTTGIGFSNGSSNGTNNLCSDLSSTVAATNLSRSANNTLNTTPSANEFNAVSYNRLYSYIPDNSVQNVSSAATSNAAACNNITYGGTFSSKTHENTTNSAHVPVIAVSSNSSHSRNYASNINYAPYHHQNVEYSMHKVLNQNYASNASSTQNRTAAPNSSTAGYTQNLSMDHVGQSTSTKVSRSNSNHTAAATEPKVSAKTSVIKPLNAYNTTTPVTGTAPINYTKYVPSYPMYTNNNKTVPTLEKSPTTVNRGIYMNTSSNHKNTDVYCPAPTRYTQPGYTINVSAPGTAHSNSNYLTANSYPLNYGHHHLAQHQSNVSHTRNLLPTAAYQTSLDESVSANYYNRQNGLVVRPTPSPYKQSQIPYQSAYNYGRSNIASATSNTNTNHSNSSHCTLAKPQVQKPIEEAYNPLTLEFDAYDRRNFRQYSSVYGSNYIDPTSFDDYSQYSGFAAAAAANPSTFYSTKAPSKILYNYNSGINVYNNSGSHASSLSSSSSSSTPQTTTSTTTVVQQPVPINPSSSQLISNNYADASSFHSHPMLPPPLLNNNNKEYCSSTSNQYQQNSYTSQILYSHLQNGGYYGHVKSNNAIGLGSTASDAHSNKVGGGEKMLAPPALGKYSVDLEDQINSSKIPKSSGTVILNPKSDQRTSSSGEVNVQDSQHRHRKSGSSQSVIESNKHPYIYSNNAYSTSYYPSQQHWPKLAASAPALSKPAATVATSSTTTHLHPKKQSLRDFLSTWNEDEEEDNDHSMSKKLLHSQSHGHGYSYSHNHGHGFSLGHGHGSQSHIVSNRNVRFEPPCKSNENVPVIVQPIHPTVQLPPNHLQASILPTPYAAGIQLPVPVPAIPTIAHVPPKIHVGIALDNGTQNLPDIIIQHTNIIDIEKTKTSGEGESFERTNVIQEAPKASEKLYILDSIDVPLSELNKYRHLSVVNKLPENIILPPPPPLRHESSVPDVDIAIPIPPKPTIPIESHSVSSNHTQQVKNDFEENMDYDEADLIETKNISIIQHVKKIIKKYQKGKHREQKRAKLKNPTNHIHVTNEHSNDLSTPLRSLSPAHGFDVETPSAVDLTVNSKEIIDEFEFIDNLSICSNDSGSGYGLMTSPLSEYLELTEHQSLVVSSGGSSGDRDDNKNVSNKNIEKVEKIPHPNENCDKINESKDVHVVERKEYVESEKENESEDENENENGNENENENEEEKEKETEKQTEMKENTEIEKENEIVNRNHTESPIETDSKARTTNENKPTAEFSIETLRNICINIFNSENFRNYFTENVINGPTNETMLSTSCESDSCMQNDELEHEDANSPENGENPIDYTAQSIEKIAVETSLPALASTSKPLTSSCVPSLRKLAIKAVLLNQKCMSKNLKPFKSVLEAESERKLADSLNADSSVYRVRTLQELAREVAVTIYSFNVKPLQDMCRLAIDKFNHLYLMNRSEPSEAYSTPDCAVPMENMSNLHVTQVERVARREEQSVIKTTPTNEIPILMKVLPPPTKEMDAIDVECSNDQLVKPLKMLAQICVDELKKCNEVERQSEKIAVTKKNISVINISSDSESETSSLRSSHRGLIVGGVKRDRRSESSSSCSSSSSSSGSDSSDDSSSSSSNESEDSSDDDNAGVTDKKLKATEIHTNVKNLSSNTTNNDENENVVIGTETNETVEPSLPVENEFVEIFNPTPLKEICRKVLNENCIDVLYEVPSLKYLCEHTLASAGLEIPLICFVNDEQHYFVNDEQPTQNEGGVFLCLNGEFDETELANLFNVDAGVSTANEPSESIETESIEPDTNTIDKSTFIDQCVALQNILSSPSPPADVDTSNNNDFMNPIADDEIAYFMENDGYTIGNQFHDSIQYEETVVPSENNTDDFSVAVESFKKYLQKKYVQPSCYHKMFALNKLLRKYKVHQESATKRKSAVQKQFRRILSKMRQKQKEKLMKDTPKKIATRRSARIAGKIIQQVTDHKKFGKRSQSNASKASKIIKSDTPEAEFMENKSSSSSSTLSSKTNKSNERNFENKETIADKDKESITRDILKLIAKKRTLKRKLSICHRPKFNFDDDGYCYDEDGQISEMVSSFINNSIDSELAAAKKRSSHKLSIESKKNKQRISTTTAAAATAKTTTTTTQKKSETSKENSTKTSSKNKSKKLSTKEKKSKKNSSNTASIVSTSVKKTDGKTVPPITLTIRTKAAVKEIIPAKRSRFLSIDGRSMKYGNESKRSYNQLKPYKEEFDFPEISKRKIPQPKTWRKKDTPTKETILDANENKSKRTKETNESERSKTKVTNVESKSQIESVPKIVEATSNAKSQDKLDNVRPSIKNPSIKTNGSVNEAQPIVYPHPKKALLEKSERFYEKSFETSKIDQNSIDRKNITENAGVKKSTARNSNTVSTEQSNTVSSTKNIERQSSPVKSTTKASNRHNNNSNGRFSEGNLRSTMVSPLKIIIEPRRSPLLESTSPKYKSIVAQDPLAFDTNEQTDPQTEKSLSPNQLNENKKETARFSEKFESFVVKSLGRDHVEKKPENNRMRLQTSKQVTSTEVGTISPTARSYCDIETLLSSTKIPQPKPAKRCMARAQTISLTESPYKVKSLEHNKWQPLNNFRYSKKSKPTPQPQPYLQPQSQPSQHAHPGIEPVIYHISSKCKTANSEFTIPKRKISFSAYQASTLQKTTNTQSKQASPIEKQPLDVSTFPDPDSLQIPDLDLRSPSASLSPLIKMPAPLSRPIQMPTPLLKLPTEMNEIAQVRTLETIVNEISKTPTPPRQPTSPLQSIPTVQQNSPVQTSPSIQRTPVVHSPQPAQPNPIAHSTLAVQPIAIAQPSSIIDINRKIAELISTTKSSQENDTVSMKMSPTRTVNMPTSIPEMNTIPLDLDRVVNQQRKLREIRRRNSVAEMISPHQRNILNKFANSIKHKKLKFEDIIKTICNNKQPSPSSSSGSSSSSNSDSSDSDSSESNSSSSSSSGSVRKSRRHRKKKRSHKRNSDSGKSSSSDSSSSSTSSSSSSSKNSSRRKHVRKSSRKSAKSSKSRISNGRSIPKPIFDIEMIKKDALMGCAMHEKMLRNKLNQLSPFPSENTCSPSFISPVGAVSSKEVNQMASDAASNLLVPYVKLQRSSIIDTMAESYAQDENNINIPLTSKYKRKRSN